jgi:glycosyltransferase involved in cell wall biosynthesis
MALAGKGQRSFYLNPHLGREFPKPFPFSRSPRFMALSERITEAHVHLPREPVFHHGRLRSSESGAVAEACLAMLDAAGSKRALQVVSFPLWLEAALKIRAKRSFPIIYDCHDVLGGFRNVARELVDDEEAMFREADLVVFSSLRLLDTNLLRHPWLSEKSVLIRNAVDAGWVRESAGSAGGRAVIGYVGALDFWFDVDSIEAAARKYRQWTFLLVGRVEDESIPDRLKHLPNVVFQGEVPHSALHGILSEFRVGLIPFHKIELTIGTNPIKLYEYFSHGLPVVSTRLPEMEEFGDLVYLTDGPASFVEQLERAVAESGTEKRRARRVVAEKETWEARADQLSEAAKRLNVMEV